MQPKPESFVVSVVDVLGILVPGVAWLLLFATAIEMTTGARTAVTPLDEWVRLTASITATGTLLGSGTVLLVAAFIGYAVKGRATYFASILSAPCIRLQRRFASISLSDTRFPYLAVHANTAYYAAVISTLNKVTSVPVDTLPGNQPFTTAKRFVCLRSPPLWADLERLEGEVRLLAGTLVAALFSAGLAAVETIRDIARIHSDPIPAACWLIFSLIALVILADSFCRTRVREVDYAYLYTLLAAGLESTPDTIFSSEPHKTPEAIV